MAAIDPRDEQMFPKFGTADIGRLRRFCEVRRHAAGEPLFVTGDVAPGMFVLINGWVRVTQRDPWGRLSPIVELGPCDFVAEVGQLSGRPALVDVHAIVDVEALLIPPEDLRALMIAEPALGDRIMRALVLRRVVLIETGAGGPVLIGHETDPDVVRLQGFMARNGYPCQVLDPARDRDAATLVERYAPDPKDLPLAVCPRGMILKSPSERDLAQALGMVPIDAPDRTYDVVIVGAGPAGLSTAVYAASEGLSVIVLDAVAFGGQAGESARIENYLGFPTGIPGRELTARALVQAQKFGAEMVIPAEAVGLDCLQMPYGIHLADGRQIIGSTVVVASGAHYRRPEIPHLRDFEGRGVWYWASPIEARLCRNEEVALVGGGNSAGQAAVFLRDFAAKVWMLVRGPSLAESMSQYLIDRITAADNIEVLTETEITALSGSPEGQLECIRWRNRVTGAEMEKPTRNVFIFIGADPATGMMEESGPRRPFPLEAEVANVFAVGDVRAGSVKRVGAAIGEGAAAVAQIHTVLSNASVPPPPARQRRERY